VSDESIRSGVLVVDKGPGATSFDVVAKLKGPPSLPVEIDLIGHTDSIEKRLPNGEKGAFLRTTFDTAPDAPVSEFTLEMHGGGKGLFINAQNLCEGKRRRFTASFTAQNGKQLTMNPAVQVPCRRRRHKRG